MVTWPGGRTADGRDHAGYLRALQSKLQAAAGCCMTLIDIARCGLTHSGADPRGRPSTLARSVRAR